MTFAKPLPISQAKFLAITLPAYGIWAFNASPPLLRTNIDGLEASKFLSSAAEKLSSCIWWHHVLVSSDRYYFVLQNFPGSWNELLWEAWKCVSRFANGEAFFFISEHVGEAIFWHSVLVASILMLLSILWLWESASPLTKFYKMWNIPSILLLWLSTSPLTKLFITAKYSSVS